MHDHVVKGIVKTIVDGIKDAQMQYDYACEAHKAGAAAIAKAHIEEASKRLDGVQLWYKRAEESEDMRKDDSPIAEALMSHYKEWYHNLRTRVGDFKM